jgi:hypothetical protein
VIEIKVTEANLHVFLSLTGHAFEESRKGSDNDPAHGYYWAMRWLARQVLGSAWMNYLEQVS